MHDPASHPHPFTARLAAQYPDLSAGHQRILDCILGEPTYGALWGVEEMAERAGVSMATIVRLAKHLGFSGFSEFREALKEACQNRAGSRAMNFLEAPSDAVSTLTEVARRDTFNIQKLLDQVKEDEIRDAVQRLTSARQRLLLGRGVAQVMADMLGYQLTQAGYCCVVPGPPDFSTQVANLGPQDLLVAFSFTPYSRETVDAAAFARECGIPVLAFSDRRDSPVAPFADQTLLVPCENLLYSHSLTTFAVFSHALATAAAALDRSTTIKRLKAADQVARPLFMEDRRV